MICFQTHQVDLKSQLGMFIKADMIRTLIHKSNYPDDPEKRETIYEKYKEFVVPVSKDKLFLQQRSGGLLTKGVPNTIIFARRLMAARENWGGGQPASNETKGSEFHVVLPYSLKFV